MGRLNPFKNLFKKEIHFSFYNFLKNVGYTEKKKKVEKWISDLVVVIGIIKITSKRINNK